MAATATSSRVATAPASCKQTSTCSAPSATSSGTRCAQASVHGSTSGSWSSHRATIGERPPGFLASERLLSFLGESRPSARASYLALVESEEKPPRPRHPLLDGDDSFIALHLARLDPSPEHPRAYLAPPRQPLDELLVSPADAAAIANAHREHGYSMREIASYLGCGLTTVHRRIRSQERVG